MSVEQTKNSKNPEAKKLEGHNKMADLLKSMGIDASQVDTSSNNSTRVKTREILTNADGLKEASKEATNEVNKDKGSNILVGLIWNFWQRLIAKGIKIAKVLGKKGKFMLFDNNIIHRATVAKKRHRDVKQHAQGHTAD